MRPPVTSHTHPMYVTGAYTFRFIATAVFATLGGALACGESAPAARAARYLGGVSVVGACSNHNFGESVNFPLLFGRMLQPPLSCTRRSTWR